MPTCVCVCVFVVLFHAGTTHTFHVHISCSTSHFPTALFVACMQCVLFGINECPCVSCNFLNRISANAIQKRTENCFVFEFNVFVLHFFHFFVFCLPCFLCPLRSNSKVIQHKTIDELLFFQTNEMDSLHSRQSVALSSLQTNVSFSFDVRARNEIHSFKSFDFTLFIFFFLCFVLFRSCAVCCR